MAYVKFSHSILVNALQGSASCALDTPEVQQAGASILHEVELKGLAKWFVVGGSHDTRLNSK